MPRYFFDIEDNGKLTVDEVGLELLTEQAVRDEAIRALPSIAQEELRTDLNMCFVLRFGMTQGHTYFKLRWSSNRVG